MVRLDASLGLGPECRADLRSLICMPFFHLLELPFLSRGQVPRASRYAPRLPSPGRSYLGALGPRKMAH
eukprot:1003569-Pyramimonas_sp.AAC.1